MFNYSIRTFGFTWADKFYARGEANDLDTVWKIITASHACPNPEQFMSDMQTDGCFAYSAEARGGQCSIRVYKKN